MTREEVLGVVARHQQALATHDTEGLSDLYAEDAETDSPLGGTVSGVEAVTKVVAAFNDAFPKAAFEFQPPVIDGNRAASFGTISGTQDGPFLGVPPTGRAFRVWIVFLLELNDGKIVRERRIYDFTGLLIQLGTLKAKPA